MIYVFIGIGGIVGSLLRYLLSSFTGMVWNGSFPAGTLFINLTGAFILGFFTKRFVAIQKLPPYILTAFSTGVVGSYTTFSTFCLDTVKLMEGRDYITGIVYIFASLVGGMFFVKMGMKMGDIKKEGTSV